MKFCLREKPWIIGAPMFLPNYKVGIQRDCGGIILLDSVEQKVDDLYKVCYFFTKENKR